MGELLKVARVDLDAHDASLRYDGLTLRVRVIYFGSVPAEAPGYEYRVSVSSLEAKWETVENNSTDPTSRVERGRGRLEPPPSTSTAWGALDGPPAPVDGACACQATCTGCSCSSLRMAS